MVRHPVAFHSAPRLNRCVGDTLVYPEELRKHVLFPMFLFAVSAWAQTFSAGVKVGTPLTDLVNAVSQSTAVTNRYLVGPTAELRLPRPRR